MQNKHQDKNQDDYENYLKYLGLADRSDRERYIDVVLKGTKIRLWFNKIKIKISRKLE